MSEHKNNRNYIINNRKRIEELEKNFDLHIKSETNIHKQEKQEIAELKENVKCISGQISALNTWKGGVNKGLGVHLDSITELKELQESLMNLFEAPCSDCKWNLYGEVLREQFCNTFLKIMSEDFDLRGDKERKRIIDDLTKEIIKKLDGDRFKKAEDVKITLIRKDGDPIKIIDFDPARANKIIEEVFRKKDGETSGCRLIENAKSDPNWNAELNAELCEGDCNDCSYNIEKETPSEQDIPEFIDVRKEKGTKQKFRFRKWVTRDTSILRPNADCPLFDICNYEPDCEDGDWKHCGIYLKYKKLLGEKE